MDTISETLTPADVRALLDEAGIDVTATAWPHPGYVIVAGDVYLPHPAPGTLRVNGEPCYSAAWL